MKSQTLNNKLFFVSTLIGLVAPTSLLTSCGEPHDRNAIINPKIEGKLVVLGNISDATKESKVVYAQTENLDSVAAKSKTTIEALGAKTEKSNKDTNLLINSVSSDDKKAFLKAHLSAGGVVAFLPVNDTIRVLAVIDMTDISKVASNDVKDLSAEDLLDAKSVRIAKTERIQRVRKTDPTNSARFIEVAAIEVEKSGALETEKTDYNENKPHLNIVTKLPLEVSTHAIIKGEVIETSKKAMFVAPATGTAADKK